MLKAGEKWVCRCVHDGLTKAGAIEAESRLILKYGRLCLDNGPLTNIVCAFDTPLERFLSSTRPIGQFDLKTRQLLKTFKFVEGDGGSLRAQLQKDGFDADQVKFVLYDHRRHAGGFWWDHLLRTSDELNELRRSFAVIEAEQQRNRDGVALIRQVENQIEIRLEGDLNHNIGILQSGSPNEKHLADETCLLMSIHLVAQILLRKSPAHGEDLSLTRIRDRPKANRVGQR